MGDDPQELIIDLEKRFPKAQLVGADRDFEDHIAQVIGFVENPGIGFDLPLDLRGTASSSVSGKPCAKSRLAKL